MKKRCNDCAGTGKIIQDGIEEYCPICDGDRYVEVEPEGFAEWLDSQGDAMAPADSFSQWLAERQDSI